MIFHIFPTELGRIPICKKNTGEVFIESIEFCWQNPHMFIPKSTCLLENTGKNWSPIGVSVGSKNDPSDACRLSTHEAHGHIVTEQLQGIPTEI